MITKINIKRVKDGSFDGDNGKVEYYWHTAEVVGDGGIAPVGTTLDIGSRKKFEVGETEQDVERKDNGRFKIAVDL
jgi:hypothetical protein